MGNPIVICMHQPRRRLAARETVLLLGLLVFVFLSGFFHVSDLDVCYHLRTAAHVLSGKGIPTTNTFSAATPEHPWMLQQWLGAIVFYLPFKFAGVAGLITFKALIGVLIMFLCWKRAACVTQSQSLWPLWAVTAGVVACRVRFFERPDLLSAAWFALLLLADEVWGKNRRWQWLGLPVLMAFWANTHSGVIYGSVLLSVLSGSEWLEWMVARARAGEKHQLALTELGPLMIRPAAILASLALACLTVQLVNPNGARVLWVPITQFLSPFWQSIIDEYHMPRWGRTKAFYLFLAGLILLQVLTRKRWNLRLGLISLTFGFLACRSQRSILFFVIAAIPHAAFMLHQLWPQNRAQEPGDTHGLSPLWSRGLRWQPALFAGAWLALILTVLVPDRTFLFGVGWYPPFYPLEIYRFMDAEVAPQNVFNDMRYGGSILWWLYPRFRPLIDGRGDAYSEAFWQKEYIAALEDKAVWKGVCKKYGLHAALLPITLSGEVPPLARAIFDDPDWALVRYTDNALLFLERTEANGQTIARYQFKHIWPGDWSFAALDRPQDRQTAIAETRSAMEFSPKDRFARTAAARVFMTTAKFEEAAQAFKEILDDFPGAGEGYWRDYGLVLTRLGRMDEADAVFSRMISKHQLPGLAYFMRHVIARQSHDLAAADRFLDRALELEPGNPNYLAARNGLNPDGRKP
jgi:tetratricopeptide (TPR) repeat protein